MIIEAKRPEEEGVSPKALLELLDQIDKDENMEMHSLQILRNGSCILDCSWKPYSSKIPHAMFSLTKTMTSLAIGFAVDDGLLTLDDKMADFFPEYADCGIDERMKRVRIRDLLTMRSGYFENLSGCGYLSQLPDNLARNFLTRPLTYEPGEKFVYNSGSTHMMSCIISKLTGMPEQMYLAEKLFRPLGMGTVMWDTDLNGNSTGAWGSYLTADQMAKLGQFMLQKGSWDGRQLLSESWFDQMSYPHVQVEESKAGYYYGYQVWIPGDNSYQADGAFGQIIYVIPDFNSVLVMTRGIPNGGRDPMIGNSKDRGWIYTCVLEKAKDHAIPLDEKNYGELCQRIEAEYISQKEYGTEPEFCSGQRMYYQMDVNFDDITGIELEFWEKEIVFSIYDSKGMHSVHCGKGEWVTGHGDIPGKELHHNRYFEAMNLGARASWTGEHTLEISLAFLNLQSVDTIVCVMMGDKILYKRSVRFNGDGLPVKKGTISGIRRRF